MLEPFAFQVPRICGFLVDLRDDLSDNIHIVRILELGSGNQDFQLNFVNSIGKFFRLVCRVDIDQNQICHSCCHLHYIPFPVVVGVDADAVFGLEF